MKAVILAAGEGQRLRPFTVNKPKVMIKVGNKPILEYVVESLSRAGIRDLIIVVGYRKSRVMDYFGDGSKWGVKIKYAIQERQIGTANALKQAEKFVDGDFVVVSGDNIIDPGTIKRLEKWSVAYRVSEEFSKYGVLELEGERIRRIVEKPKEAISNLLNTGIYMFGSEIFEYIRHNDIPDVINEMIDDGYEFRAVESGKWLDIVYPWDIIRVNELAMNVNGTITAGRVEKAEIVSSVVGRNSVVRFGAYVEKSMVGENCDIGQNAVIKSFSSIGDNVRIGAFAYIENSVIGDNVIIGPHSCIKDSVIDSGCVIKAGFTAVSDETEVVMGDEVHRIRAGAFIGENCMIGANVVAEGGAIVGNNSKVASNRVLSGKIPDDSTVL
ncbi:bifunctional sugar-1-phosphate nucleotidylyltransferase/acetyltransferase [Archaeoglobus neptunius]|uniref:bifunctional sugar-1-phosphate nucleotidylyltransferase/acetyltransferase n=1 Tax=Archaeoglobus neptunius TaxID=2798580 RepID=UPI001928FDC1|nr:bifunctional sugar-1-phosphate nucleotidylyltransferase/acetyltransferase [Archaeoglobus neptunius]